MFQKAPKCWKFQKVHATLKFPKCTKYWGGLLETCHWWVPSSFHIYKKNVDLLIKLQKIKSRIVKNFLGKSYKLENYSINNLHKESDLFFDWYLPLFLSKKKIKSLKKRQKKFYRNFIVDWTFLILVLSTEIFMCKI